MLTDYVSSRGTDEERVKGSFSFLSGSHGHHRLMHSQPVTLCLNQPSHQGVRFSILMIHGFHCRGIFRLKMGNLTDLRMSFLSISDTKLLSDVTLACKHQIDRTWKEKPHRSRCLKQGLEWGGPVALASPTELVEKVKLAELEALRVTPGNQWSAD